MQKDQDYKGSLQKTYWRSTTSSSKVWWFDNSRSQSPQWGRWISKQSPIRSRGTRCCHLTDSIFSVQNWNFSGDGNELAKVLGAEEETKSHWHWQFHRIWQSLWRSLLESLHVNTPSIRDEWHSWRSGTQNKGSDVSCIVAIRHGWKKWWLILWNAIVIRDMSKTSWQRRQQPHERQFGDRFKRPRLLCLVPWLNIILYLRRTSHGSTSLVKKFYQEYSSGMHCSRREFGKVLWFQTRRSCGIWTRQKAVPESSMQRKDLRTKKLNILYSQSQMEQQNCLGETMEAENPLQGEIIL